MSEHTPTPWQIGITLYPYVHFYGPSDKDGFAVAVGSCVTAFGKENDEGNARFIVRTVNAHVALVKALQKIADLVDSEADEPLDDAIKIARDALDAVGGSKEP